MRLLQAFQPVAAAFSAAVPNDAHSSDPDTYATAGDAVPLAAGAPPVEDASSETADLAPPPVAEELLGRYGGPFLSETEDDSSIEQLGPAPSEDESSDGTLGPAPSDSDPDYKEGVFGDEDGWDDEEEVSEGGR